MSRHLAYTFKRATVRARRSQRSPEPRGATVTIGELLQLHGEASAAVLLLVLALMCVMPIAGVGTVLGTVLLALAWRWHRGPQQVELPQRLRHQALNETWSRRCLHLLAWLYVRANRWLKSRWQGLYHPSLLPWWGAWIGLMALIIILPIPFGNVLPSTSLVLMSLAWMFRDGLVLVLSTVFGAGAIALALAMGHAVLLGSEVLMRWLA